MPQYRNDPTLEVPVFPGSHLVIDEDYIFVSGLTVTDIQGGETVLGDLTEETNWIMRRLERMLAFVGTDLSHTVRVDVHLTNLDDIHEFDAAYAEFFDRDRYPARTCTESPRLYGGANVEVTLMVRRPEANDEAADESAADESPPNENDEAGQDRD
ncbi:RidA family protein [Halomonas sp. NO4]|uniref:RidA family protein n=1 Tax=Halomonas sp. NO4 TaxID=2484813 RepID=UPI0013D6044B|nr:RidA family protein [Halomonas sp. NO4]